VHQPATHFGAAPHLRTIQVHTVCQDRSARQRAELLQPFQRTRIAARQRVGAVGSVLGHMDMHHCPEFPGQPAGGVDRLVRHREARVQSDQAAQQRGGWHTPAFLQAALSFRCTEIAFAGAVAQQRSHTQLFAHAGQDVQRSFDQVGRLVVIDQRRRSRQQRAGYVIHR
jgi:hypothetical protein